MSSVETIEWNQILKRDIPEPTPVEIKEIEKFVDRTVFVFYAPVIAPPLATDTIDSEMKERATLERMKAMKQGVEGKATDYEAMLYIQAATLITPIDESWFKIYAYLFKKFFPDRCDFLMDVHDPEEYAMQDLERLKKWIYIQQLKHIKEKGKQ